MRPRARAARALSLVAIALTALVSTSAADAQEVGVRGFGDFGGTRFAAAESFKAVLGSPSGVVFGGGGEALVGKDLFVGIRASRFRKDGTRVFVLDTQTIDLGIPTTVTVTPIQLTGGYRFAYGNPKLIPYAGGGIGWYRYEEVSDFATDDENVKETHTGYHVVGGAETRVTRWLSVAGEAEWSFVPDALGQDPNSASAAFDETNLGGLTFRVKLVLGR